MPESRYSPVKLLSVLFYIQLATVFLTLLSRVSLVLSISLGGDWISWCLRAGNVATAVVLFLLPQHYRGAAISKAVWLVCSLLRLPLSGLPVHVLVPVSTVLSWATLVISLICLYLEYFAHASFSGAKGAKAWHILFFCAVLASVIPTAATALMVPFLQEFVNAGTLWVVNLSNLITYLPSLAVSIFYLILLRRTIDHITKEEEPYGN